MRYVKRVPGYIVALFLGTAAVVLLKLPVETIGTRFGGIPSGLPTLRIPHFRLDLIRPLISPAITVAMLGAIESLMSAVVSDRMSGDKHNPNVELVGQGVANILSPLFSGLPATGAIARTATNIRSGAKTPVSGMIHALTLLAIVVFAAPLARFIPLSVLAAILMVVSYNMGEWREIPELLKLSRLEIATWLVTFLLTVFADLTVAVEAGMILAVLVFIKKVTQTTTVSEVTEEYVREGHVHILQHKAIPAYVAIFRIHGPFLFGATDKIEEITSRLASLPPILILRLPAGLTVVMPASGLRKLTRPQRRRRTGVCIERVNTVVLGCHYHDVMNTASRNCHLRHVERLGVNITIQRIGVQLAEPRGIHVGRRQHGFVEVLAGPGIVIVVGAHRSDSGMVNNPSTACRKWGSGCYEVFTIGACGLGPAPVVHLEDNHKQRHARSHGK